MSATLARKKQEVIQPTFRYSDEDLQEFKELILIKLETAKYDLNDAQTAAKNPENSDGDREQFNQLANRQKTLISHLEEALFRIENKTYGICRETGKLIDKARLKATLHATLSIEAKNAKKN